MGVGHEQQSLSAPATSDDGDDEERMFSRSVIGRLQIRHQFIIDHLQTQHAEQVARELQVQRYREQRVKLREEHSDALTAKQVEVETLRQEKRKLSRPCKWR